MGIWKPKGPPTPRDPIVLINDPSYAAGDGELGEASPDDGWSEALTVGIRLNPDMMGPPLEPGDNVLVMCPPGKPAEVWLGGTNFQQIGELTGPGTEIVSEFIQTAHTGLTAAIVSGDAEAPAGGWWLSIPPPSSDL